MAHKLRRFNAESMLEEFRFFREHPGVVRGISTGFGMLDYITGGLKNNELILLAARPGMGKSMLALNIADSAVKQGYPVAFFSQEMSEEQLLWRLAAMRSGISMQAIQHGFYFEDGVRHNLTEEHYRHFEETVLDIPTWDIGVYVGGITTEAMKEAVSSSRKEIGLVVTDHIGLHTDLVSAPQYQRMVYISRALKDIKLEFGLPIIAVAQLSRAVEQRESKKPQMSDLRDSGSLEQDADQVWALYREDYYSDEEAVRNPRYVKIEVDVLKNRSGSTGCAYMQFDKHTGRFFERMEQVQPERRVAPVVSIEEVRQAHQSVSVAAMLGQSAESDWVD